MMLPILAAALALLPADGHAAYVEACASCHGVDLRGGASGPRILGVGAANLDFWMSTGRMPAAQPWIESGHLSPTISPQTMKAIVSYATSVQPGGVGIPAVFAEGNLERGRELYREQCMQCHGVAAEGAAIGDQQWAPSLERATVIQVAEAIRIGPGEMPAFGEKQLAPIDVDDIVTYLSQQRAASETYHPPLPSHALLAEGSAAWMGAGALLTISCAGLRRKRLKPPPSEAS